MVMKGYSTFPRFPEPHYHIQFSVILKACQFLFYFIPTRGYSQRILRLIDRAGKILWRLVFSAQFKTFGCNLDVNVFDSKSRLMAPNQRFMLLSENSFRLYKQSDNCSPEFIIRYYRRNPSVKFSLSGTLLFSASDHLSMKGVKRKQMSFMRKQIRCIANDWQTLVNVNSSEKIPSSKIL